MFQISLVSMDPASDDHAAGTWLSEAERQLGSARQLAACTLLWDLLCPRAVPSACLMPGPALCTCCMGAGAAALRW